MISVLTPSRGRPNGLRASADSVFQLANHPENVNFWVAIDPDEDTDALQEAFVGAEYIITTWQAPERYGYVGMNKYLNGLANRSLGEWLVNWNDDATMVTEGWDDVLNSVDPSVMVAGFQDNYPGTGLTCFPAIRRRAVDALGEFCIDTPHVDTWWQDIGHRSGRFQEIAAFVHHDRFDLTGANNDTTWQEGRSGLRSAEFYQPAVQTALLAASIVIRDLV